MKKLLKILPVIMVICLAVSSVFAVAAPENSDLEGTSTATGVTNTAKNIWSTLATVVQILAVAAVVFAGVRYMFASADQKADIKKGMIILVIGAVLVFGATTILKAVQNAATKVVDTSHVITETITRG